MPGRHTIFSVEANPEGGNHQKGLTLAQALYLNGIAPRTPDLAGEFAVKKPRIVSWSVLALIYALNYGTMGASQASESMPAAAPIRAYCIDFNWGPGGPNGYPQPGHWADADPQAHVAWYKGIGCNVIQTFCVSCNGYAWYKGGVVPEQPGLKHDFLRDVVRLGHREKILVMGYFCIASNTHWGRQHPDLSYGSPSTFHIPYTREYLAYLDAAIRDAVKTTGIDGFMIDWVWMPDRKSNGGKWLPCEKKLYKELMGEDFPGEGKLSKQQDTAYSRKAIDRCWTTIRKAAKETNPNCIIWLSCFDPTHPHVVNSRMFKEMDWLMNERRLAAHQVDPADDRFAHAPDHLPGRLEQAGSGEDRPRGIEGGDWPVRVCQATGEFPVAAAGYVSQPTAWAAQGRRQEHCRPCPRLPRGRGPGRHGNVHCREGCDFRQGPGRQADHGRGRQHHADGNLCELPRILS